MFVLEKIFEEVRVLETRVGKETLVFNLNSNFLALYEMTRTHPYL